MTFKVKTKNKISQVQKLTLDALHIKQIKKFQSLQKSIPQKKKEISKLEEQIDYTSLAFNLGDAVKQILHCHGVSENNIKLYLDLSCNRKGQDVRYALDDSKLRSLGWNPNKIFVDELPHIVDYYKKKFIW